MESLSGPWTEEAACVVVFVWREGEEEQAGFSHANPRPVRSVRETDEVTGVGIISFHGGISSRQRWLVASGVMAWQADRDL